MSSMIPQYNTILFSQVYNDAATFLSEYKNNGIQPTVSDDNITLLFYLLYARYGNNPIANYDVSQFKYKLFSVIFQYGPTWESRLKIQKKLRDLLDDENALLTGSKAIYNRALNPGTAPSTSSLSELSYINEQNTTSFKKNRLDAYGEIWELLKVDVTENFLNEFKKLFKLVVAPEQTLLYVTYKDEDEDEE